MATPSEAHVDIESLSHVASLFSDGFLRFTPKDRIERDIFSNAVNLIVENVNYFTIYDWRGVMRLYFATKYGGSHRRPVGDLSKYKAPSLGSLEYFDISRQFRVIDPDIFECTSSYYLERKGPELVISQFNASQHKPAGGLRLTFLDRTHAHSRIINAISYPQLEPSKWIMVSPPNTTDRDVKYSIPSEEHITQPSLQRQLNMIDNAEIPLPDLMISVQAKFSDILLHCISRIYMKWLMLIFCVLPFFSKMHIDHYIDVKLVFRSIIKRINSIWFYGMGIIHPFGPCGLPPWFLACAELHECFSLSQADFWKCVDDFYHCQRRNGK
ncbi:anaphase-promoting complex subunit 2, putative [Babesia ovis]|uniref:Anaphase-promoting complex subunit 2, putative n=1 Tax=Babesia ovis TaxID=5869 RepID=A0A9W5TBR8_BABOV|nr:anaphase-promoting complex subunit 2, putative [Babesia ovis]